jgi:hypothetical protein
VPTSAPTSWTAVVIADVVVPIPWQSTAAPEGAEAEFEAEVEAGADADADAATAPELGAVPDVDAPEGADVSAAVVDDEHAASSRATKLSDVMMGVPLNASSGLRQARGSGATR